MIADSTHPQPAPSTLRQVLMMSRVATILAGAWALLTVAMATVAPMAAGEVAARAGQDAVALRGYALVSQIWALLVLPTYVVVGVWLWRARTNADLLAPPRDTDRPRRHRLWAWLGWLLPVLQLWIPYQVVRDTAEASSAGVGKPLLRWWWGTWIGGLYCGALASQLLTTPVSPSTVEGLRYFPQLALVAAVCTVVAMGCWITILRRISAAQSARR